jgi:hypothetical protein
MKTKITFIIALCIISTVSLKASKHFVSTTAEFNTAWGAYVAGDTIVMNPATYSSFGDKTITKSVTIIASDTTASATKPVIEAGQFIFGTLTANTSFVINGIEAYFYTEEGTVTDSKYFLQAVSSNIANYTIPLISIRNCKIHGYSRGVVRADNSTAANQPNITTLFVNNCLIYDISRVRADYSIFACKTAKFNNVIIKNSTFYNSPAGVWYNENTTVPVNFLMDKCCLIKTTNATTTGVQTNVSKLIIYNNGNAGSTRTISNSIISDSYDGSTTNMQIKFGSDGTTNWGNADNLILGNNMATTVFNSTTLTTDNKIQTNSFSYQYSTFSITTDPGIINNVGDPRWKINGVWTATPTANSIDAKVFVSNGKIVVNNLPTYATVEVYSINGRRIYSVNAVSETMLIPVSERNAIVRVAANGTSQTYKVGF